LKTCSRDRQCARAFPRVGKKLRELLAALEEQPLALSLVDDEGASDVAVINAHDFLSVLHWMLYNAQALRLAPLLIDSTHRGDPSVLRHVVERIYPGPDRRAGSSPAFFAIVCRDQHRVRVPRPSLTTKHYAGFSITSFMDETCAHSSAQERVALDRTLSHAPALLLSGRFDPMTPARYARDAAAHLKRAVRFVIDDAGHSTLSDFQSCQTEAAVDFLDDLVLGPASECLSQKRRPEFVLTAAGAID
jgi:pimeloyl-ACP methyl ester carboxylesterase